MCRGLVRARFLESIQALIRSSAKCSNSIPSPRFFDFLTPSFGRQQGRTGFDLPPSLVKLDRCRLSVCMSTGLLGVSWSYWIFNERRTAARLPLRRIGCAVLVKNSFSKKKRPKPSWGRGERPPSPPTHAHMPAGGAGGRFRPWLGIGSSQPADGAQLRLRGAVEEVLEDIETGEAEKEPANEGTGALESGTSSWESTTPPPPTAPPLPASPGLPVG